MRLLERDEQMRTLDDVLARAAERHGRVVLVNGPAGIGKTSLVRAFAEDAEAAGAVVHTGACADVVTTRAFARSFSSSSSRRTSAAFSSVPR